MRGTKTSVTVIFHEEQEDEEGGRGRGRCKDDVQLVPCLRP